MSKHRSSARRSSERGSVIVFTVIALSALIGVAAWATETGRMWQVKTQLQSIADGASLAAVGELLTNNFQTVNHGAAETEAATYGLAHDILGNALTINPGDIEAGSWDLETRTFTPLPGSNDPDQVRAVRVATRRDNVANGPVPTILGRALGVASVTVNSESVAYRGFGGSGGPGVADLPITLDCCEISGDSPGSVCSQNYCTTVSQSIPNECALAAGGTATCLQFQSTPEQNACWTQFDGNSPSINTTELRNLVATGNTTEIDGPIYLDNGTKTPVIREIKHRFEGTDGYHPAEGTDTDGDSFVDSWVVTLPVVECQNPGPNCAGGSPQDVVGFVCFDIHQVDDTGSEKVVRGSFVCPTDPRCDITGLGPGGTLPGGISAQYPVIVD